MLPQDVKTAADAMKIVEERAITHVKVGLFDLAALDEIYRVLSVIALGLLLLAGAFAYQRLRASVRDDVESG